MKRFVSKEQIEQARQLDLLSYLQRYEPNELVKISSGVYSLKSHDSLKISNGQWYRWSTGIGGVSALDYLVKVENMGFVDVVLKLCDCNINTAPTKIYIRSSAKKPFKLPTPHFNNERVIAYLSGRGISKELISSCIKSGRLFEDTRHNCCFIGFDNNYVPKYAMLRSSDPSSSFLREVEGSDKRYSFYLPKQESETLYLFESAIDTLSFVELQCMNNDDWKPDNYLSLSGIYQPAKKLSNTALPVALSQYLHDTPMIKHITLCLDNDEAGRKAAMAIRSLLPDYSPELLPPEVGKDYNEQLMILKNIPNKIKTRGANSASYKFEEEKER